jgi:hypothetical protein
MRVGTAVMLSAILMEDALPCQLGPLYKATYRSALLCSSYFKSRYQMQSILHSIIGPSGPETADLTGKVAIVTGGPLGIVRPVPSHTSKRLTVRALADCLRDSKCPDGSSRWAAASSW